MTRLELVETNIGIEVRPNRAGTVDVGRVVSGAGINIQIDPTKADEIRRQIDLVMQKHFTPEDAARLLSEAAAELAGELSRSSSRLVSTSETLLTDVNEALGDDE